MQKSIFKTRKKATKMSDLKEKVLAKKVKTETIEVDDCCFLVVGMPRKERSDYQAAARKKDGKIDGEKLESDLLAACVREPGNNEPVMSASEWDEVSSHITAKLVQSVMRCCGFDNEDMGKKSDSTEKTTT